MKGLNSELSEVAGREGDGEIPGVAIQVIELGGNKWVAGLAWKMLTNALEYRKEAKQYGRENSLEMVAIREFGAQQRRQAGFAPKIQRRRLSLMYSLAAGLATALGDQVLAAFKIGNDRYVVVHIRDGGVQRDRFGSKAEAMSLVRRVNSQLQAAIANKKLDAERVVLIAPGEFEIFEDNRSLLEVLPKRPSFSDRLQPLHFGRLTRREGLAVFSIAVLFAAGFAGFTSWQGLQKEAETAARAAMARASALAAREKAEKDLVKPWEDSATPALFIGACQKVMDAAPLSIGGWDLREIKCSLPGKGDNSLRYSRADSGSSLELFAVAALDQFGAQIALPQPDEALIPVHLELVRAGPSDLGSIVAAERRFVSRLQERADIAAFRLSTPVSNQEVKPAASQPPAIWWRTKSFAVDSDMPAEAIFDGYSDGALRIQSIALSITSDATMKWKIEGEIYGKAQ
ncbi:type 4b pilus protein PilO2 [Xanthomonas euvesicatoria pv. allii]|uniref:type 4b pilus protein PilO2 n=1 Tax=Xanthomonas euvesicatoria TaxID=456327 RepID=UPI002405C2B7|nr:type 4b pilus protein PilO2 [Xanthomonas euvesicatoria]MCP3050742.1 type 4b pilus protein PilO2 [Xanthomonas euvesicatoria pv. allii]